jgi:hypothetical protein
MKLVARFTILAFCGSVKKIKSIKAIKATKKTTCAWTNKSIIKPTIKLIIIALNICVRLERF